MAENENKMPKSAAEQPDMYEVLAMTQKAGELLLENGAEIFRVEETMQRIAAHYGVKSEEFFVLSNGIFMTGDSEAHSKVYARVRFIPMKGSQLYKVVMVNQLSREIEEGKWTVSQADRRLDEIREAPGKKKWTQIGASGVGAAAFCILFGGSLSDAAAALIAGLILYIFLLYCAFPKFSRIVSNITGGALVTIVCMILYKLGLGNDLNHMIIGSIIPMIPGVAFTNGIRDLAEEDYLSGMVRLLDSVLGFICIAIGVGLIFIVLKYLTGGVI